MKERKFLFKIKRDLYVLISGIPIEQKQGESEILATENGCIPNPVKDDFVFVVRKLPIKRNKDIVLLIDKKEFSKIFEEEARYKIENTDEDVTVDVSHCAKIITKVKIKYEKE